MKKLLTSGWRPPTGLPRCRTPASQARGTFPSSAYHSFCLYELVCEWHQLETDDGQCDADCDTQRAVSTAVWGCLFGPTADVAVVAFNPGEMLLDHDATSVHKRDAPHERPHREEEEQEPPHHHTHPEDEHEGDDGYDLLLLRGHFIPFNVRVKKPTSQSPCFENQMIVEVG